MGLNDIFIPICLMYCMVSVQSIHRPVIGVLMQKADQSGENITRHDSDLDVEYVVNANYVKALEGAGAMVVPVKINEKISYYRTIMSKINGIVFPGGSANLQDPTDIGRAGGIIYRLAKEYWFAVLFSQLNNKGVHFPILGVCQGMQLMAEAETGMKPLLTRCQGLENIGLPLTFVRNPRRTKLYREAPKEIIRILTTEPVTANYHSYCVTQKALRKHHLTSTWRVMTVNYDDHGMQFVSSMEHTRWFYDWFFEESKKNHNQFTGEELMKHMMGNYCTTLVTKRLGTFEEYLFSPHLLSEGTSKIVGFGESANVTGFGTHTRLRISSEDHE